MIFSALYLLPYFAFLYQHVFCLPIIIISYNFPVLYCENLEDNGDINRVWDTFRENIKISAKECIDHCEAKRFKPWFDEGCSKFIDRRKETKLQWLQDPSVVNEDT
jgi:hypothetical protein